MELKNKGVMVGDYTWEEFRDMLIIQLKNCRSQEELTKIACAIAASIGTEKEITRVRKRMGIKPLTKDELKKIRGGKK